MGSQAQNLLIAPGSMVLCRGVVTAGVFVGVALGMFLKTTARAEVDLGDVTISEDTIWAEDSYRADSLTVTAGATLRIAGGSTLTVAGMMRVTDDSAIELQGKNADGQVEGEWAGVGVTINAADVRIDAGSAISADRQGYRGGVGPGVGGTDVEGHGGAGGGYGGIGGHAGDDFNAGGATYGDAFAPRDLGSGGGPTRTAAGDGGGAVRLNVSGMLELDGAITANGGNSVEGNCFSAPAGGGGSGGSIYIQTATLAGSGSLTANGGAGSDGGCFPGVGDAGGGGAGGRVAVFYGTDDGFAGFTTSSVSGGAGGGHVGGPGTMVFLDSTTNALRVSQHLDFPVDSLPHFGTVTVDNSGTLSLGGGATLTVDGDLIVSAGATVIAQGKNIGGLVDGEWRGAGAAIDAGSLRIDAGCAISADAQGYLGGLGPGAGGSDAGAHRGAGGGHGGIGGLAGDQFNPGGAATGVAFAPVDLGSGGGVAQTPAGSGGGAITITVRDALTLDGIISARGGDAAGAGCAVTPGGGGAGGSIFISAGTLQGGGRVTAEGGAGGPGGCTGVGDDGGGGAGGRIAVQYAHDGGFSGFTASSVSGGAGGGYVGAPGTMVFLDSATNALRVSQNLDFPPESTPHFAAVTVDNGATLTLGGGTTLIVDNDLIVSAGATVIAQSKNTGGLVDGEWRGAGATIDAGSLRIDAGCAVSADAQGYLAGLGPGAGGSDGGAHRGAGGGHGGVGGLAGDQFNPGGAATGAAFAPVDLGSGGGVAQTPAGSGGGAITITVRDVLTLDGTISARGGDAAGAGCAVKPGGGGAGGSIFISAGTLQGVGTVVAEGGSGGPGGCTGVGDDGGGGAGGRIAVLYASDGGFGGFTASSVSGGTGGGYVGAPGTMVFLDSATNALRVSQNLDFPPDSTPHFAAVTVDNGGMLTLGGGTVLAIDRDLILADDATVVAQGKHRDAPVSGAWEGAGVTIRAPSVRIDSGSEITADEQGYAASIGPGVGVSDGASGGGGGGYGGQGGAGGDGVNAGGATYGDAAAPLDLGSGGGPAFSTPGVGGGAVRLDAETLTLDGVISARGGAADGVGCSRTGSGGGAGGSILIVTTTIAGTGSMIADGGAGGPGGCTGNGDDGGGGGGGRIAVHYSVDADFAGFTTSTVNGGFDGIGRGGEPGTLRFISCGGDCNGDGRVTIAELVRMVNIALGRDVIGCLAGDVNRNAAISVDELVGAVNHALSGCPA